jgi:hypothetical protein
MDPELAAMQKIADLLTDLDTEARQRVISWAADKFSLSLPRNQSFASPIIDLADKEPAGQKGAFKDFAEFFHALDPKDYGERALAAAFWLSLENDGEAFGAQAANNLLKNTGYQVANITDSLSQNIREKPALVIQIKKSGSSRQARKLYKITDAGRRKIKSLIGSET